MAGATTQIKAELIVNNSNWQKGLEKAARQTSKFGKSVTAISNGMKAAILGVGTAILTGFVGEWVKAAEEARQADQRLEKVAKTINVFGDQLPSVTKRLKEFADQQEIVTGITAEEIKAAQTKILTYTAVAKSATKMGGIFDRTTMAAIDLAATGFGTVESNADTLGKALANPLKGLAALQKQGFVYSEQQKKQFKVWIDQGKLWKAQEFILKDIESQVQGVAEASGSSLAKFQNAIGQVTDAIGEQFLPLLDRMIDWFKSPSGKKAIQSVIDQIEELGKWFTSKAGQDAMAGWAVNLKNLIKLAGDFLGLVAGVASLLEPKKSTQKKLEGYLFDGPASTAPLTPKELQDRLEGKNTPSWDLNKPQPKALAPNKSSAPVITNITVNAPNVSGQAVLDALKKTARKKGLPLKLLID
jgi:hypothetical protein